MLRLMTPTKRGPGRPSIDPDGKPASLHLKVPAKLADDLAVLAQVEGGINANRSELIRQVLELVVATNQHRIQAHRRHCRTVAPTHPSTVTTSDGTQVPVSEDPLGTAPVDPSEGGPWSAWTQIPKALQFCVKCQQWIEARDGTQPCRCPTPEIVAG